VDFTLKNYFALRRSGLRPQIAWAIATGVLVI
jgi:hypothetical protein